MLHILYYKNQNFIKYRVEVMNKLQIQVIILSEEDLLPLCLLEKIFHEKYLNLLKAPTKVNSNLCRFRIRNL